MRIFDFTALEFGGARLYCGFELCSLLSSQLVMIGEQYLNRDSLRQLDGLIEHDLPVGEREF